MFWALPAKTAVCSNVSTTTANLPDFEITWSPCGLEGKMGLQHLAFPAFSDTTSKLSKEFFGDALHSVAQVVLGRWLRGRLPDRAQSRCGNPSKRKSCRPRSARFRIRRDLVPDLERKNHNPLRHWRKANL